MINRKNIFAAAALALAWAAPLFAGPVIYPEAAAPWTAEQAVRIPPAITPAFLREVANARGSEAAARLSEKKERVSALLERYETCALNAGDMAAAEKYFTPEFSAEIRNFAGRSCADLKDPAGGRPAAARSVSLDGLEGLSASGAFATAEGSSRFFDGAKYAGAAAVPVRSGIPTIRGGPVYQAARPSSRTLSSKVPAIRAENRERESAQIERPADLGKDGRVNQALAYWAALRKQNWEACKKGDLAGAEKARALMNAAAGAGFGGLLAVSNLPNIEIAAARLGRDVAAGAGSRVIAADSAKLVFHSGVFLLALAPIPIVKVLRAAAAGEVWAVALVGAMASGPVNRYLLRVI